MWECDFDCDSDALTIISTYLSLTVCRRCVAHKNLVYDHTCHEFSIAQWLERQLVNIMSWVRLPLNASSFLSLYSSLHFTYIDFHDHSCVYNKAKNVFHERECSKVIRHVLVWTTLCTFKPTVFVNVVQFLKIDLFWVVTKLKSSLLEDKDCCIDLKIVMRVANAVLERNIILPLHKQTNESWNSPSNREQLKKLLCTNG